MQQRREFLEQLLYLWWESGDGGSDLGTLGAKKGVVLALVKVRPEAAGRTCCLDGIIESSNLAKEAMPKIGLATAASKKSNSKFWPENRRCGGGNPRRGFACHWPLQGADLWAAPSWNAA
jgi:hypothetical protein